jgi:hypothetical protein
MKLEPIRAKATIGEFKLKLSDLIDQKWSTGETLKIEDRHYGREKSPNEYIALLFVPTNRWGMLGNSNWKYATMHAVETLPNQEILIAFKDGFVDPVYRGSEYDPNEVKSIDTTLVEVHKEIKHWSETLDGGTVIGTSVSTPIEPALQNVADREERGPMVKGKIRVPTKPTHLKHWREIWRTVRGMWNTTQNYTEITNWLNKAHPSLHCSAELMADIIKAGEAGLLDK